MHNREVVAKLIEMQDDPNGHIMPWGKFKGRYVHSLPSSYLRWVAENCDWDDATQLACDEEYQFRDRYNSHKED